MKRKIELHWEITNGCNLRCRHCIVNGGEKKTKEASLSEIKNFISKIEKVVDIKILFTGGEPFYRKDFFDILNHCIKSKIKIEILTNGLLLEEKLLKFIETNNISLGISIESDNEKIFNLIRGKETYPKLMKNLSLLRNKKIKLSFYSTITSVNLNDIEGLFKLAKEFNAELHFNEITIEGRAKKNRFLGKFDNKKILNDINKFSKEYFNEKLTKAGDGCWVDSEVLHINSEGKLFFCTEICRKMEKGFLGNIKSFPIERWYSAQARINFCGKIQKCPYRVYYNSGVTYVSNIDAECTFTNEFKEIKSLSELRGKFEELFKEIYISCKNCNYPDCSGYIWILNEEFNKMYNNNISLLRANKKIHFLNCFKNKDLDDKKTLAMESPKCEHRCEKTGKCLIHNIRPFVCVMYPIGLESFRDGTHLWVIHTDCQYVQDLIKCDKIDIFILNSLKIINNISKELNKNILDVYIPMSKVTHFPHGENNYIILKEVNDYKK